MKHVHRLFFTSVLASILLRLGIVTPLQPAAASGKLVTLALTAEVEAIDDPTKLLGGAILS